MLSQTSYQYSFLIDSSSVSSSAQSTSPSISRSRTDTKYLSSPSRTMTSTNASAARASGSPSTGVNNISNDGKKNGKKNVPFEFTAQGTTPSGKPRLFVCQVCTRAFARLEHLRRHERSHTKEKPFSCGVCQRKFSRRDLLLRHAQKLHAGCSDAITRLRRKSIKRSNNSNASGNNDDEDIYEIDDEDDDEDVDMDRERVSPTKKSASMSFPTATQEPPFKLNSELSPNPFGSQRAGPSHTPRRNSGTHESGTPLQRQMFDHRKKVFNTRNRRGASFSAQSGANYASGMPEFNDMYPNPENVEFSTPQMLPSSMNDEINWLNNLSSIPGMSNVYNEPNSQPDKFVSENLASYDMRQNSVSNVLDNHTNPPPNVSHHGSFSHSLASSHTPQDPQFSEPTSHIPFMMPTATTTSKEIKQGISASYARNNSNPPIENESSDYGYSFYDIPDSMVNMNGINSMDTNSNMPNIGVPHRANSHMYKVLTPIKQDIDEEMANNERAGNSQPENFDLNFLNDMDELTQGIDVNSRFLPNGYSFYGDNGSVSSSGMETNSPSVLSPSLQSNMNVLGNYDSTLDHNQLLDIDRNLPGQSPHRRATTQNPNLEYNHIQINTHRVKSGNFHTNKLFTNNLRQMIHRSLAKYPISGVVNPSIPSNEKLEFYLSKFVSEFLTHLPFIHQSKLNEYEMMNMTVNEDWNNESARVCLPLLIATIGALLASHKQDSEHLYEASRRTIHIYLESRKSSVGNNNDKTNGSSTVNPLWLIQSLMLSVIYGLFSDNENNVYIVIRQLSALNSLVKTSIKSKRSILFSVSGEDEESFNIIKTEPDNGSLFPNNTQQEQKFRNNINVQAQTRIVLTIYRLTNFLLMMYNVPLTLSVNDLAGVTLPNRQDEFLWNFKTYQEFQEFGTKNGDITNIDNYLNGERLNYKDFLFQLIKVDTVDIGSSPNQNVFKQLEHLSKFGFSSITHGLYELKQYQETKSVDIFVILDTIAKFFPPKHLQGHSSAQEDSHRFDFALLANFTKLSSMIDLKSIQEQSWLRNYGELTKNYNKFLSDNNPNNKAIDDYDYLGIVDCCLMIIRLVLFKYEDHYEDETVQDAAHSNGLSGFSTDFGFLNNGFEASNVLGGSSFSDLNTLLGEASRNHNYGKPRNGEENTIAQFEKSLNIRVTDEFEISSISMHSQMLFHAFTILSIFSIYISRRNNSVNNTTPNQTLLFELNSRFSTALKLLDKVEIYLKTHYQQQGNEGVKNEVLDQFFSNLYLYNGNVDPRKNDDGNNYTLEKTLYILKIGEVVLNFLFDRNIKVSIFKKLSGSLAQIRKSLIDNEATVLG